MRAHRTQLESHASGFSMPEVLISSALLSFLVASSTQLYVNSGRTVQRGSARDAVYARIADDLEDLRRETWRFACEDGTACTGRSEHADMPVAYKTARKCAQMPCAAGELLQVPELTAACSGTMSAYMAEHHTLDGTAGGTKVFPVLSDTNSAPTLLDWSKNLPSSASAPPQTARISIERRLTLNADQNQLDVAYNTSSDSPISVSLNASLVPQALSWCP